MKAEETKEWKHLGDRFEQFRPDKDKRTPSEWWILAYVVRSGFLLVWRAFKVRREKGKGETQLLGGTENNV